MNKIEWQRFADLEYWFEGVAGTSAITRPLESGSFFFWFFVVLFSVFFGIGVIMYMSKGFLKRTHPLVNKFTSWGGNYLWMGILGSLWIFMRQAEVGFLGARMWLLAGLAWFVILHYLIIKYLTSLYKLEMIYFNKHK